MTSDVTFLKTSHMPAIKPDTQAHEPLILNPNPKVDIVPYIASLNSAIAKGNPIAFADIHGECRITRILKQLPNGNYECMALVVIDELKICDSNNYQTPFTQ